jgi:hypothetical protein
MALFHAGDTLKVLVMGNDGILRSAMVSRTSTIVGGKYVITQRDIFLQRTSKASGLIKYDQPCILFYENSIHAVPKDGGSPSYPSPEEVADLLESASFHLFQLMGKSSNMMMILLLIIAAVAAACAGGGAYYGYLNDKSIKDVKAQIAAIPAADPIIVDNGIPTTPTVTIKPTVVATLPPRTVLPTVSRTISPPVRT